MIKEVSVVEEEGWLGIIWKEPAFSPTQYIFAASCTYACSDNPYQKWQKSKLGTVHQFIVKNVAPGSHCDMEILAIYNAATLDTGIKFHYSKKATG